MQSIVLGGGCFWCTEAVFLRLKGVVAVTSGYMGGSQETADYQSVCTGQTGHVEVIKVDFDPTVIALDVLLSVFFATHDPTTKDRQGNDIGTQYASVVFACEHQKALVQTKIDALKAQGMAVVTQVRSCMPFYPAETYHQNFDEQNPTQGYCCAVIPPRLQKLADFGDWLK